MKDRLKTYKPHFYASLIGLVLLTGLGGYMIYEGQSAEITVIEMDGAPSDIVFIADPHLKSGNLVFMSSVADGLRLP